MAAKICAFSNCNIRQKTHLFAADIRKIHMGETQWRQRDSGCSPPDTTNLTYRSTRSKPSWSMPATIDTCDTAEFFSLSAFTCPFPGSCHALLDIVVGSVSGNLTASDVVEASAEGSVVHAGIFVPHVRPVLKQSSSKIVLAPCFQQFGHA